MVVPGMQAAHDLLEYPEAHLFSVEVDTGPVTDHHSRLAAVDYLDHASLREVRRDEAIGAARRGAVPAAGPIAGAADDGDDAPGIRPSEPRGVLDTGGHAALPFGVKMTEVVRDLRLVDVTAGLQGRLRQLGQHLVAEPARRGDPFAREPNILQDLQRISHVAGDLVHRLSIRPLPVFLEAEAALRV